MKAKLLLIACLTGILSLPSKAQKVDWMYRLGDTSNAGSIRMSPDTYLYNAYPFIGKQSFPNGDTLTTADNSNAALCIVKYKKNGDVVWARKVTLQGPTQGDIRDITISKIAFSPCGDKIYVATNQHGAYATMVTIKKDGTNITTTGLASYVINDISVDSNFNGYAATTQTVGGINSWVLGFDSTNAIKWSYYFARMYQSKMCNVQYVNGVVHFTGQFQGTITVFDTLGSASTVLNAPNSSAWNVFTVSFSPKGKKLGAASRNDIAPPSPWSELAISSEMTATGYWVVASLEVAGFPKTSGYYLTVRKYSPGFSTVTATTSPLYISASYMLPISVRINEFGGGGVIALGPSSWLVGSYTPTVYTFNQSLGIGGTVDIPSGTDFTSHDYAFDHDGNLYASASMTGSSTYIDSTGAHTLSNKAGTHSAHILKYHVCANYAPIVNNEGDSLLRCSLTGFSYQWYKDGNPISGATQSTYVPKEPGSYSVQVSDGWGCSGTSFSFYSVEVHQLLKEKVSVYPNPVTDIVYVEGLSKNQTGYITDISGKHLMDVQLTTAKNQINLGDLTAGIYFLYIDGRAVKLLK